MTQGASVRHAASNAHQKNEGVGIGGPIDEYEIHAAPLRGTDPTARRRRTDRVGSIYFGLSLGVKHAAWCEAGAEGRVSKNPVPESVRESWARIRSGAKVAVEQGAKAIRLLVGPNLRVSTDGSAPGTSGPTSERRWVGPPSSRPAQGEGIPPSTREIERASYRRIQTPGFFRPAGLKPFLHLTNGEGGEARLRMYSDEPHICGEHLKLVLVFPSGEDRTFTAEIAWLDELPPTAPARFDVGLRVLDIDAGTKRLIASVLSAQEA
jgi:hypothetical protein